jgi:hypothetical protein
LRKTKTILRGKKSCIEKIAVMSRGRRRSIKKNDNNNTKKEKEKHH